MATCLCKACGTQYAEQPGACPICEDPRQYIPHDEGQVWVPWDEYVSSHAPEIRDDHGILGIGATPSFGIGQRALLVKSAAGNVLWDCIPYLDDDVVERVTAEGGLAAIAVSHPHFYTAMVEWAHAFACPVYVHEAERSWVMRPDPSVRFWEGESLSLGGGLTLVRCGGHFDGAQVLHWEDRSALLAGDVVMVVPDRRYVSFMWSYPNLIPLPAAKVEGIAAALAPFHFDTIHSAWWDRVVPRDGSEAVRRSAERYVRALAASPYPVPGA
jgi:glyoxylase-like metal-dependent hydrolase (beta-lactamase superfamily II)